jgi:DNA-directed RNA polymerase sigma subunit (sigma70/sigma32)
MDIPVKQVQILKTIGRAPVSLDTLVTVDGQSCLGELIEDCGVSPADAVSAAEIAEEIVWILKTLSLREEKIMRLRFGIGCKSARTVWKRLVSSSMSRGSVFGKLKRRHYGSYAVHGGYAACRRW